MTDTARKVSEIIAIAQLEPSLKNIYVEGMDDWYLINDFLNHHKKTGIGLYTIDSVDFSELYEKFSGDDVKALESNNKKRVILLASTIESNTNGLTLPLICLIDRDWDFVTNDVKNGKYIVYTDYNSMELYLMNIETVDKYLRQGFRINNPKTEMLISSIKPIVRQIFHLRCFTKNENEPMIGNDRDFSFEKSTYKCKLNFESLWAKTINNRGLASKAGELKDLYNQRIAVDCDEKLEIRGHDFIHYLCLCVKRIKSNFRLEDEYFSHLFWSYLDLEKLAQEPLFRRILEL